MGLSRELPRVMEERGAPLERPGAELGLADFAQEMPQVKKRAGLAAPVADFTCHVRRLFEQLARPLGLAALRVTASEVDESNPLPSFRSAISPAIASWRSVRSTNLSNYVSKEYATALGRPRTWLRPSPGLFRQKKICC